MSAATRSALMSRIRGKDTGPELALAAALTASTELALAAGPDDSEVAHGDSTREGVIKLAPENLSHTNISTTRVAIGALGKSLKVPGRVALNANRTATVTSTFEGRLDPFLDTDTRTLRVRVEMPTNQPIVLLRERDGSRYLPIWIGAAEATAIAYAQQGVVAPRPLTHDLLKDVIEGLGRRLDRVRIDALRDKVFYATLELGGTEISARPSDGIALALRAASPILVSEEVFEEAGITMAPEEDDEVEKFREFLDHVSPEDFEAGGEPQP